MLTSLWFIGKVVLTFLWFIGKDKGLRLLPFGSLVRIRVCAYFPLVH